MVQNPAVQIVCDLHYLHKAGTLTESAVVDIADTYRWD